METTTVEVKKLTKARMDVAKLCKDESYDSEINRLLNERENKEA